MRCFFFAGGTYQLACAGTQVERHPLVFVDETRRPQAGRGGPLQHFRFLVAGEYAGRQEAAHRCTRPWQEAQQFTHGLQGHIGEHRGSVQPFQRNRSDIEQSHLDLHAVGDGVGPRSFHRQRIVVEGAHRPETQQGGRDAEDARPRAGVGQRPLGDVVL